MKKDTAIKPPCNHEVNSSPDNEALTLSVLFLWCDVWDHEIIPNKGNCDLRWATDSHLNVIILITI